MPCACVAFYRALTRAIYLPLVGWTTIITNHPTTDQLQAFFLYLIKQRKLSPASCHLYLNGIRFFYLQVIQWPSMAVTLAVPKKPQRIPELLTRDEVGHILSACDNGKHRMMLTTCYCRASAVRV